MPRNEYGIDPALLAEFVDESEEALEEIAPLLVEMEQRPGDLETVRKVFRPIHSLKGNAAYFGLMRIKDLAHKMENVLDRARQEHLVVDRNVADLLLEGVDLLADMLSHARELAPEVDDESRFEQLIARLVTAGELDMSSDTQVFGKIADVLTGLRESATQESPQLVGQIEEALELARQGGACGAKCDSESSTAPPASMQLPESLTRLHNILVEPLTGLLGEERSREVRKLLDELIMLTRGTRGIEYVEQAIDYYETMVNTVGFDDLLRELLLGNVRRLAGLSLWGPKRAASPVCDRGTGKDGGEEKQKPSASRKTLQARKTMRVAEENVDDFLEYVGELIVVREMFGYLRERLKEIDSRGRLSTEFQRAHESFSTLSHNLQQSIMAIRRVPVRGILQKVPRIVRDIAAPAGKQIDVHIEGEEVEIDKTLVELLEAPIVHMVRNAADHGIETPAERERHGKSPCGQVTIRVREMADTVVLTVEDDGAGLDLEALKSKATELGLCDADEPMSEERLTDVLFASGISTASAVTDVSGRGVGMDVVRQNIERAGGSVAVDTTRGKGTHFIVDIPKAVGTQIIKGFLIAAADQFFVFPVEDIVESFCSHDRDFVSVASGRGTCVKRHGEYMPYAYFGDILGSEGERRGNDDRSLIVVSVRVRGRTIALGVDDILGLREAVVKPVPDLEIETKLFAGAAMTGSGELAMVVDFESMPFTTSSFIFDSPAYEAGRAETSGQRA